MNRVWQRWERRAGRRGRRGLASTAVAVLWTAFGVAAPPAGSGATQPGSGAVQAGSGATQAPATPPPTLPLTSDQVAGHLGETVDWFHHLAAMEQLQIAAGDTASRDKLHQESLTAVELAFDFGKA